MVEHLIITIANTEEIYLKNLEKIKGKDANVFMGKAKGKGM